MSILQTQPVRVPLDEVAKVLAEAAARAAGGPPTLILATGWQLATALEAAGFQIVRDAPPERQLTL